MKKYRIQGEAVRNVFYSWDSDTIIEAENENEAIGKCIDMIAANPNEYFSDEDWDLHDLLVEEEDEI